MASEPGECLYLDGAKTQSTPPMCVHSQLIPIPSGCETLDRTASTISRDLCMDTPSLFTLAIR